MLNAHTRALHTRAHNLSTQIDTRLNSRPQSMDRLKKPDAISQAVRKKTGRLSRFAKAAGVPLLALCACAKDDYRKPAIGAWRFFCDSANGGVPVDLSLIHI